MPSATSIDTSAGLVVASGAPVDWLGPTTGELAGRWDGEIGSAVRRPDSDPSGATVPNTPVDVPKSAPAAGRAATVAPDTVAETATTMTAVAATR
jgi:hypothetical protein